MFSWEFENKKEKSITWYITASVIWLALIIYWLFTWMYTMSLVVLILVWVYLLIENNSPDKISIEIDDNWVLIWEDFYDYPKIESYSIVYNKNIPELIRFRLRTKWFSVLDIPYSNQITASEIRNYLNNFLEEDKDSQITNMDKLINYLKL